MHCSSSIEKLIAVSLLILAFWLAIIYSVAAEPISGNDVRVIDGDTIEHKNSIYRLTGYDTPEMNAKGTAERLLARLARQRLVEIIASDDLDLTRVDCNCRKGTEGTLICNFGRMCGTLTASSRYFPTKPATNVAETLISEGLALAYQCAGAKCPPRKSWCER